MLSVVYYDAWLSYQMLIKTRYNKLCVVTPRSFYRNDRCWPYYIHSDTKACVCLDSRSTLGARLTTLRAHRVVKIFIHSFRSTLDFDSDEIGSTNHTQLKLQEGTHLPCAGWVCGVIKRQMFATGIFKTEFSLCHFWIKTRNEFSVISDLAIHKLLNFCTRHLCEAVFLKLIKSPCPKTDPFWKMLRMSFVLRCLVSIYEWLICAKIIKCIHPIIVLDNF